MMIPRRIQSCCRVSPLARAVMAVLVATACRDPVRENALAALGPEAAGVPAGPLHRPGQPCTRCHGDDGPAKSAFSLAGTVFLTSADRRPAAGVLVRFIDADGSQSSATTNCAGNFYVDPAQYAPRYPVWLRLQLGDITTEMVTPIYRDSSCAGCHHDPAGPAAVSHVYLAQSGLEQADGGCP